MTQIMTTKPVFVTIDSKSTKDIDDAVCVARVPSGFLIHIAIADPTNEVAPGSPIDQKARELAATIYARDTTKVGMLPPRIAQGRGSLIAQSERHCFCFEIELDSALQVVRFEPTASKVTVAHRLAYEDIPRIAAQADHELHKQIRDSVTLAQALLEGRRAKGALAMLDLQRFIVSDEEGNLLQLNSAGDTIGHVLVQELMILTNSLLGQYLVKHNIPALYRNHQAALAAPPTAELRNSIEALLFSGAAGQAQATDKLHAILGKARYEPVVWGHYGLNLAVYAHGTSPLRRYPDLVNLRQLKCYLMGEDYVYDQESLAELADHINQVLVERKESSRVHFKSVVARTADRLMAAGKFASLDDAHLAMAIKNVRDGAGVRDGLAKEIIRRLKSSALADTVVDRLFLGVKREAISDELASEMSAWLYRKPERSMHLFTHGRAIKVFADVRHSHRSEGGVPYCTTSLKMENGATWTGVGADLTRKRAEQYGLCGALVKLLELPPIEVEPPKPAPAKRKQPRHAPEQNPKSALFEACSKNAAQPPVIDAEVQGPPHMPQFRVTARVTLKGQSLEASSDWVNTKKAGELSACQRLLESVRIALKTGPQAVKIEIEELA